MSDNMFWRFYQILNPDDSLRIPAPVLPRKPWSLELPNLVCAPLDFVHSKQPEAQALN